MPNYEKSQFSPRDVFIGYNDDAPAATCLHIYNNNHSNESEEERLERAKVVFLQCATPDAISRSEDKSVPTVPTV